MTPALDILAGMLAGTLMGLIASAHAAVLLTYRPPRLLQQRIADGRGTNVVTVVVFGLVVLWVIAGVVAALAADALIANAAVIDLVPSSQYLVAVIVVLIILGGPVVFFLRDRWKHGVISLGLAFCIYGFLIPNAVIALQNRL